jgi:hypothetical protein
MLNWLVYRSQRIHRHLLYFVPLMSGSALGHRDSLTFIRSVR